MLTAAGKRMRELARVLTDEVRLPLLAVVVAGTARRSDADEAEKVDATVPVVTDRLRARVLDSFRLAVASNVDR